MMIDQYDRSRYLLAELIKLYCISLLYILPIANRDY